MAKTTTSPRARRSTAPARRPESSDVPDGPRVVIEAVTPQLDAGRYPIKRIVGESVRVEADIYKDGHDLIGAQICYRAPGEQDWRTTPMHYDYNSDRWSAVFTADRIGRWEYTVEAWPDEFGTWRAELEKKLKAGHEVHLELLEGAGMIEATAARATGSAREELIRAAQRVKDVTLSQTERATAGMAHEVLALMDANADGRHITRFARTLAVLVDRLRAQFAAWYEMFPRSAGTQPGLHGTFADAERLLPRIAALGFDVLYLPPIHPIGVTKRKGKNNALEAGPDDPGSPWAIGSELGGHTAIDPRLGTLEDFDRFVRAANAVGLEIALDYALQCSPDHPWLKEHPDWFFLRPDGTIKYAENPPKKYEDIYPMNFWCADHENLWKACRDIFLFWIDHGVKVFRVDNPHTKPMAFWEWCLDSIRRDHPDVIFLSEAFTRPKRMKGLAKLGFTQSYTYFTWRNTAWELREYLTELCRTEMAEYFRGNLFTNTPDILHEYLQAGGRAAFKVRLLLAATLSPLYGIYSGFELCENVALRPGSEEYLHSEKYEIRTRDWNAPGNINDDIARMNRIRRENPALQAYRNLSFHTAENDQVLFYHKAAPGNDLLCVINLDPFRVQETTVYVPVEALGLGRDEPFVVEDLLTGERYNWRGVRNYVRLAPPDRVGHVLRIVR